MLTVLALIALLLIVIGTLRFLRAYRAFRVAQARAAYRADALVTSEEAKLRAAQHRASERQWGRAA